jgi:glycine cleavage system H protein
MKEIEELNLPDNVRYTKNHEYARPEDDTVWVGISDYAQDQLGDIVFVELPSVGDRFATGDEFGTVESVKAVAELYMPLDGEVVARNNTLEESPQLVNQAPYADGWMVQVKPDDPAEMDELMTSETYRNLLKGLD